MRDRTASIIAAAVICAILLFLPGCGARWKNVPPYTGRPGYKPQVQVSKPQISKPQVSRPLVSRPYVTTTVRKMGYTIQVGAFNRVSNAVRLTKDLEGQGIDAFYFPHRSGLYKVRFGDYASLSKARAEAARLQKLGIIDSYYVVNPSEYTISKESMIAQGGYPLRRELVKTARNYIGVPYQWGSCQLNGPVDCSGLVLAVYELNGLDVPRTSEEQYQCGIPVEKTDLQIGDLVFFSTNGDGRVSHVGIYIGDDRFIHAPGRGKTICEESLSRTYYSERYIGACTYLR